ncbi:hypothetical protein GCM10011410_15590 [Hoyosella rhizosphaerae]|uniref:Uncharacterized protein n=1 Tax=Hoyosella rhizosphaerae TaxID=1755582 RepID=A0A916U8A7_9ACTN|nr:hypothetical protein GCM10011410_15590 [Hoyosella rhizosphaerae]
MSLSLSACGVFGGGVQIQASPPPYGNWMFDQFRRRFDYSSNASEMQHQIALAHCEAVGDGDAGVNDRQGTLSHGSRKWRIASHNIAVCDLQIT